MNKRGYYFSIDALIALVVILGVVLFIKPTVTKITPRVDMHEDLIHVLSTIKIGELDNGYAKTLIAEGKITNLNYSVLEQIGEFYALSSPEANDLTESILLSLYSDNNIGIYFNGMYVGSLNETSFENASDVWTSRQIVSGIQQGQSVKGYSARAFLSSSNYIEYFYFGGYVGDGNLTINFENNIVDASIEAMFGNDFDLYINDDFVGSYSPDPTIPLSIDLSGNLDSFNQGINQIKFFSTQSGEGNVYVAGGYIKITHNESANLQNIIKKKFPGVKGFINLYDGFYVPGTLNSMDINLHYNSTYDIFMSIGNVTVFEGNSSGNNDYVMIPDSTLSSILNYNEMSKKTIPLRIGMFNVSYIQNQTTKADVFSVTDLSGSMLGTKLADAISANLVLVDAILNYSGNRVGLAGYGNWSQNIRYHTLSNDNTSLKNDIGGWEAEGFTCVCCGIEKAISCFDPQIFFDDFEADIIGSDPMRWTTLNANGAIDVVGPGLNDNRAVRITRNSSQNPQIRHYFAPQEDKLSIEFYFKQIGGGGRLKLVVEGANPGFSNYNDFAYIKMYGGFIRNGDTALSPYVVNTTYKVRAEITPNSNSYDLYVDDVLVGSSLPAAFTQNNIARLIFITEGSNVQFDVDDVNVFLTDEICEDIDNDNFRAMILMSDGLANRGCGLDPVPDYDGDGVIVDDHQDHAVQAACDAYNKYGIVVHVVGFGNGADEFSLQLVAACGGGSYYFGDVGELTDIYNQISGEIIEAAYSEQTITGINIDSALFSDSYITYNYQDSQPFGLVVTAETEDFGNEISEGSFFIPDDAEIVEAKVISYSGSKWTDRLDVYNPVLSEWERVYNLSVYGDEYVELGDPFFVNIPKDNVIKGDNEVRISASLTPSSAGEGSNYDKVIYTVVKNITSFSPIKPSADGCRWTIEFEDGTISVFNVPPSYSGPNSCSYTSSATPVYNPNDALDVATFNLLESLDFNKNGKVETKFTEDDLVLSTTQIQGIPFAYVSEVQVRVWR